MQRAPARLVHLVQFAAHFEEQLGAGDPVTQHAVHQGSPPEVVLSLDHVRVRCVTIKQTFKFIK